MSSPNTPDPWPVEVSFMDLRYTIEIAIRLRAHLSPKQKAVLDIDRLTYAIAEQLRLDGMKVYGRPKTVMTVRVGAPPADPWD